MSIDHQDLVEHCGWLADKIVVYDDYTKEAAFMLRKISVQLAAANKLIAKIDNAIKSDLWKCWHGSERFDECNELANEISGAVSVQIIGGKE